MITLEIVIFVIILIVLCTIYDYYINLPLKQKTSKGIKSWIKGYSKQMTIKVNSGYYLLEKEYSYSIQKICYKVSFFFYDNKIEYLSMTQYCNNYQDIMNIIKIKNIAIKNKGVYNEKYR